MNRDRLPSILSALPPDSDCVAVPHGTRMIVGVEPDEVAVMPAADAFRWLDAATGWWAGFVSYEAGHAVERIVERDREGPSMPDVVLGRFDARLVIEGSDGRIEGDGPSRATLERVLRESSARDMLPPRLETWESVPKRPAYEDSVRTVLERIAEGECYQVNLTRRLVCRQAADPVALFSALVRHNPAPYASMVRLAGVSVVSASPECFLRCEDGVVRTRPIKGTSTDPVALAASEKDRAENVMIVDLARNDLGRVCVPGTVRVAELCAVERHPGLYHLVSTVGGRLRDGVGLGRLLRATFPPASITGAPKPRVMQIIEDLEPVRRGVYCGAIGWLDLDRGALDLSVAIRTFAVVGGETWLGVGGGVVADSTPHGEWAESELKARRLLEAAGGREAGSLG